MNKQVITIHPGGAVSGLQVKPGKGLNLQSLGKAKTVRASEIVWHEDAQAWYVDVLQTPGKGPVTGDKLVDAFPEDTDPACAELLARTNARVHKDAYQPIVFDNYEDAVTLEVAYLDTLRLRGEFPSV